MVARGPGVIKAALEASTVALEKVHTGHDTGPTQED
eukprot:SAG31_NODE_37077_length_307_cov_1.177885_1_plen_35_part_10